MSIKSAILLVFMSVSLVSSLTALADRVRQPDLPLDHLLRNPRVLPGVIPEGKRPVLPQPRENPDEADRKKAAAQLMKTARAEAAKLDGTRLIDMLKAKHAAVTEKMNAFAKELVKVDAAKQENLDPHVSIALALEMKRLAGDVKTFIKGVEDGKIDKNETNIKQIMAEDIMALDMDRMLIAYGMEILKSSQDPAIAARLGALRKEGKQQGADALTQIHRGAAEQVQTRYRVDIQNNWLYTEKDFDIGKASIRAVTYAEMMERVFADPVRAITPETTIVTTGLLRATYAQSIHDLYGPPPRR